MPTAEKPAFRFGPFELLTDPPALYRDGQLATITPKALATLTMLVSKHGLPVGKDELLATIWSGTAVGEANLTQNVYTLRKLLASDFPDQNAIENLPRFGYRFNLPVSEEYTPSKGVATSRASNSAAADANRDEAAGLKEATASAFPAAAQSRRAFWMSFFRAAAGGNRTLQYALAGGACAAVAAVAGFVYMHREAATPPRIYNMVELTNSDANNQVKTAAPSPDGKQIAYANEDGLMLRERAGGPPHPLRAPDLYGVSRIAWFPDESHLAVSGQDPKTHVNSVWSVSVAGDVPMLLRTNATNALPSPDGTRIAFEANDGKEIWVSALSGGDAKRLLAAESARPLSLLLWSGNGDEVYLSRHDADHYAGHAGKTPTSGEFLAVDATSGRITSVERGEAFDKACLLPDDELLLAGNEGEPQVVSTMLREVEVNPRTGAFRSQPRLVQTLSRYISALDSAQDGRLIDAVIGAGQADVYIADLDPHEAALRDIRRLTYEVSASYPHSWTPDSKSVLFESRHKGPNQLYRQAIDSHTLVQLVSTPFDAAIPIATPDGRWILFEGGRPLHYDKLFRIPGEGGAPAEIKLSRGMGTYRCPLLRGACVLRQVVNNEIVFSRLDPILGEGKPFFVEPFSPEEATPFAVSPDGTELATIRAHGDTSLIRLEKFDKADKLLGSSEVVTDKPLQAMQWRADGRGWFAEVLSPTRINGEAHSLYFIDPTGKSMLLARSNGHIFGVPSPDGKKLAMVEATGDSNIWSLQ